jgi:hypothetical protein
MNMNESPVTTAVAAPTPLHIETRDVDGFDIEYVCTNRVDPISGKTEPFCFMPRDSRHHAEVIVRAVNNHAELLAALKAVYWRLWRHALAGNGDVRQVAEAAIAKAEGPL